MAEEEIWDSWEDFADSTDLDKHVDQHLRLTNGNHYEDNDDDVDFSVQQSHVNVMNSDSFDNGQSTGTQFRILPRPVVHEDDVNRTAYIPQVKILKRPGKDSQASAKKDRDKQKSQPARTLAEREAAYAEARKRIMGPPLQGQPNTSNMAGTGVSKSREESRKKKSSKPDHQTNSVPIERQPKGPDKTGKGFSIPR